MAECVDCDLKSFWHAPPQTMHLVATARRNMLFYQQTHRTRETRFSMDCKTCSKAVCSDCLYIDNMSLDEPVCARCRANAIKSCGYTIETKSFFTKENRRAIWTMLLLRLRWKKEGHPLAVLPKFFWLQNFSKCLL